MRAEQAEAGVGGNQEPQPWGGPMLSLSLDKSGRQLGKGVRMANASWSVVPWMLFKARRLSEILEGVSVDRREDKG